MTKEQVLQGCTIDGMIVKLPPEQLDRKLYEEVKKSLELIGGKWKGGKVAGFVFPHDPVDLLAQISNGEKRNLKKEYQFFATPDMLADKLVELAELRETDSILEPSAGQGAIIKAIQRKFPQKEVSCYELMPINQSFLIKMHNVNLLGDDFLANNSRGSYDRIVANPPFTKNQDIDHINMMWKLLRPGGRMVSMASVHWRHSTNKKEKLFKEWLYEIDAAIIDVPAGTFKESGTTIETVIIVIDK